MKLTITQRFKKIQNFESQTHTDLCSIYLSYHFSTKFRPQPQARNFKTAPSLPLTGNCFGMHPPNAPLKGHCKNAHLPTQAPEYVQLPTKRVLYKVLPPKNKKGSGILNSVPMPLSIHFPVVMRISHGSDLGEIQKQSHQTGSRKKLLGRPRLKNMTNHSDFAIEEFSNNFFDTT